MPSQLADPQIIKDKLEIPRDSTAFDNAISVVANAVNSRIARLLHVTIEEKLGIVEIQQNIQVGIQFYTKFRPIRQVTDVAGRMVGEFDIRSPSPIPTWTLNLEYDIIDYNEGLLMIVPGSITDWPPIRTERSAPWFKHQEWMWDIIQITYDAKAWTPEPEVANLANDWAVYLWHRSGAAAATSRNQGILSERLMDVDMPPWVLGPLSLLHPRVVGWTS